ncbi:MAG: hypothetical protein V5A46_04630 [Haloferacaceae archaeon]
MDQWLARPLGEVVEGVSRAVADGQLALDEHAIETTEAIAAAEGLEGELDAPWFRFTEVEANVTVALSLHGREIRDRHRLRRAKGSRSRGTDADRTGEADRTGDVDRKRDADRIRGYREFLAAAPHGPELASRYDYDANATSSVRFRIAPVPPTDQR